MKTQTLAYMACVWALACSVSACGNDDGDLNPASVPAAVMQSFKAKYPNVKDVEWQADQQYYVADFNLSTFDTEAWFSADGTWAMTETDYDTLVSMLPLEVTDAFNDSPYSSWIVDEATLYERPVNSFCVIEVESNAGSELSLFYDTFGDLLNKIQGDYFEITPTTDPTTLTY